MGQNPNKRGVWGVLASLVVRILETTDYYKVALIALGKYINKMKKEGEKNPKLLEELYNKLWNLNSKIFTTLLELERMMKKQDIKQRK
ncbi:MAG: hypothetical protein QW397_04325 [Fervidicoccaceae archaeon]